MEEHSLSTYIIVFFIFSFLGYISEVLYCSIGERRFINRGFLKGPIIPIYGFGGLVILLFLSPLKDLKLGYIYIFLSSMAVASVIEYIGSWLLERIFKVKLWDYSSHRFNIKGRVCLKNSMLFGLMGVLMVKYIEGPVYSFVTSFSISTQRIVSIILLSLFSIDFIFSTIKMNSFRNALSEISEKAKVLSSKTRSLTSELRLKLEEEYKAFFDNKHKSFRRLISSFPGATSSFDELRKPILELIERERELRSRLKHDKR